MKILHLIDSLDYSGSSRQLCLLAKAQAGSAIVCCLGAETPWSASLREAGVAVHALGWTRWLDFSAWWNLRTLVRQAAPDVVHVWRHSALRTLAVAARDLLPRVVMSGPLSTEGEIGWLDCQLVQRVGRLAVAGASDRDRCVQQGIDAPMLRVVSPAIADAGLALSGGNPDRGGAFVIACVGNLERDEGGWQAVWAFDFLRQLYTDAILQMVGAGSQLDDLRALAHGLQNASHVEFLGARSDVAEVLRDADVVWIPSQANCGRQVALDAMACGRPVVASNVPCLREVIRDGETGFLSPVADIVQLARRTHTLFQDAGLRDRIGRSAQAWVRQHCALADAVARWHEIYREIAA
ncbi:MAG: glycosyltransferase [Planctomycetes bacterium]|nr:glycosyltransferase [Planctomycetota bacterium]